LGSRYFYRSSVPSTVRLPPWRKKLKDQLRKTRVEGTEGVALATNVEDVEDVNMEEAGAEDTV
jgi:hypothetical protein